MRIGNNLKRLRQEAGLTQKELSAITGIKLAHLSKIERDVTDPKLSTIAKLIEALDCTANSLLFDKDNMTASSVLRVAMEKVDNLTDEDKQAALRVIEALCVADGVKNMLQKDGGHFIAQSQKE